MKRPATLLIDGKPYLWRDLLKMRRERLEQCPTGGLASSIGVGY